VSLSTAFAQVGESVRQRFEAGLYDEALQLVTERRHQNTATAGDIYLAAQILLKLGQRDQAKLEAARLSERSDGVWRLVAQSTVALIEDDTDHALTTAEQAAAEGPDQFFAFYQLGLVKATREDWSGAAGAFARASELDPAFAYARYHAGLSYSRIKRVDLTAVHFEAFLKLAPKAPERPAVESIMRTLRGR